MYIKIPDNHINFITVWVVTQGKKGGKLKIPALCRWQLDG